jgi:hypothetical protein
VVRQHQPSCWKLRTDGLVWIATTPPDENPDRPAPDTIDIAIAIGMSRSSVYRMQEDPDWPLANAKTVAMAKSAAENWGIPYIVAFHRIFRDPTILNENDDNWFAGATTAEELTAAFATYVANYAGSGKHAKACAA